MKHALFIPVLFFALHNTLQAKSKTELAGDILAVAIPSGAYATAFYLDDEEGEMQFYKSYATTLGVTYLLKYTVREKRPESEARTSFPSGHTASAFAGASFIQQRYGWKYSIVPYVAAIYTGYSRVASKKHHPIDVYAAAALGMLSSWYFVTPYKNVQVKPLLESDIKGLRLSYSW